MPDIKMETVVTGVVVFALGTFVVELAKSNGYWPNT